VGDLAADTAVSGADGRYSVRVSRAWEIWGPNGGYVASLALRAAGVHTRFARPASIVGHFLGVAAFDAVDIEVTTLRAAKRAESLRVSITQGAAPIFEALVWTVDDLDGIEYQVAPIPAVTAPADLLPSEELLRRSGEEGHSFPFWDNLEWRPLRWIDDWEHREPGDPVSDGWYRFRPPPASTDPFVDACRLLVLCDTLVWPATCQHYVGTELIAPSIDIAVQFHRLDPQREWLFARAEAPSAAAGLVGGRADVWGEDGTHLASGSSQLLCRRVTA
jgi:acyl-CoA thioesterase